MGAIQLVEYTDPYSVWCWGAEPIVRKVEYVYGDLVDVRVVMGGLFEDFTPMREYWARMSGGQWQDAVLAFLTGVAGAHRMPMDARAMMAGLEDFRSTWPACIAVGAAALQGPKEAKAYLRRLREAAVAEGQAIHRAEVQAALAGQCGLDVAAFGAALASGEAERRFRQDLEECRAGGVTGFPSFELRGAAVVRLEGFHPWPHFEGALRQVAPELPVRRRKLAEDGVMDLLRRYARCATREIAEVFDATDDEAEILLEDLEVVGHVRRRPAGTGLFWEPV